MLGDSRVQSWYTNAANVHLFIHLPARTRTARRLATTLALAASRSVYLPPLVHFPPILALEKRPATMLPLAPPLEVAVMEEKAGKS